MTKLYAQEKQVFDINKFTVVGSPTITSDGVLTNTSQGNYIKPISLTFNLQQATIMEIEFETGEDITTEQKIFSQDSNYQLAILNTQIYVSYSINWLYTGENTIKANTRYKAIVSYKDNKLLLKLKELNTTSYTEFSRDINPSDTNVNNTTFGGWYNGDKPFLGKIYLDSFRFYIDGELVYSPTKPTYLLERRKEGFDLSKFTVVGSPTITEDGVASGFGIGNSVDIPITITSNKFTIEGEFTFGSNLTDFQYCCEVYSTDISRYIISVRPISDNYLAVCYYNGTGTEVVFYNQTEVPRIANKSYKYKIEIDGTTAKSTINGITKTINNFVFSDVTKIMLGSNSVGDGLFYGSINLSQFSITVDGKEVFTGAKEKFYAMRGM